MYFFEFLHLVYENLVGSCDLVILGCDAGQLLLVRYDYLLELGSLAQVRLLVLYHSSQFLILVFLDLQSGLKVLDQIVKVIEASWIKPKLVQTKDVCSYVLRL